jgi:putative hydrolase of the HAD superfamily
MSGEPNSTNRKWIIFDADNTLWDVEPLYNSARVKFCEFALDTINKAGENANSYVTKEIIATAQRHRDIQLRKTHGYSASRFARSFEDTLLFFMQYAPPEAVIHARTIALDVFQTPAPMVDDLDGILARLSPTYTLAIITAGEEWVQKKRLEQFHLADKFVKLLVVEKKNAEVFRVFCDENSINPNLCWMVGDSIPSDIEPALAAGLKAIHVQASNWAAENGVLPKGARAVPKLKDILGLLL